MSIELRSQDAINVAVLADTHIPDRVKGLHPQLLDAMVNNAVDLILHAGDISLQRVLDELREVAPVYAVRGNRDLLFSRSLPMSRRLRINGVSIYMTHGHINMRQYWRDKFANILHGYQFERYYRRLLAACADAEVIIYGHSHHAEHQARDGRLFFNPGSCSVAEKPDYRLSFGILEVSSGGEVKARHITLSG